MADDRARCLAAGCTEYLSKPVEREVLLATLRRLLPAKSDAAQPAAPATGLRSTYAHEEPMRPLIAAFVAELSGQVRQLQQLMSADDREGLRRRLHQLKGSGGGYGFQPITDAAARAEQAILEHRPLDEITARVRELLGVITSIDGYQEAPTPKQEHQREAA
jgi:HPt (histidine-containing phosphotransfer) domain-containing protein